MRILLLTVLLTILTLTTSSAEETTTNNLISQDFSTGWSGTATQRHGNSTVAAVNNTYIKSNDVSLKDDANLTEAQLQDGFTSNHSFKYWHWNNYNSTVTSKVTITKPDGEATTQIRTYSSTGCGSINCGSYQSGSDTLSISRNTQTDFDINVRYDFTDTSNSTAHYSVDLKEPSLTITYESEPIDQSIQDEINDIFEDLQEEVFENIEEFFFEEETFTFNEEIFTEEIITVVEMETLPSTVEVMAEEIVEEVIEEIEETIEPPTTLMATLPSNPPGNSMSGMPKTVEEEATEIIEEIYEEEAPVSMATEKEEVVQKEEAIEESAVEEENNEAVEETDVQEEKQTEKESEVKTEEKEESGSEESTTEVVSTTNNTKQKNIRQKKNVNIDKIMAKVDEAIKDLNKNLQIKNIIKLEIMTNDQVSLVGYITIPFYKSKDIYLNQLNMSDPRLLYTEVTLNKYKVNDPVFIKQELLHNIRLKKHKLLIELEQLKNG